VKRVRSIRLFVAAALAVGLVAAFAGAAHAATAIVYVCGNNLCRVDPATGAQTQLTTDGTADSPYRSPSLSRAGTKLAFARGSSMAANIYVADGNAQNAVGPLKDGGGSALTGTSVVLRGDGSAIGYLHESYCSSGGSIYVCFNPRSANPDGSNDQSWASSPFSFVTVAWGPDGLLSSDTGGANGYFYVCRLYAPTAPIDRVSGRGCNRSRSRPANGGGFTGRGLGRRELRMPVDEQELQRQRHRAVQLCQRRTDPPADGGCR
jgi:hypothetical protein